MRSALALLAALLLAPQASAGGLADEDEGTCVSCHEVEADAQLARPVPEWRRSVHARHDVSCDACHGGDPRLEDEDESMSEEAGFLESPSWMEMADYCGVCHEAVAEHWTVGRAGTAMRAGSRAPDCTTCHMSKTHDVEPAVPEDLTPDVRCPGCATLDDPAAGLATLRRVREREAAVWERLERVQAKGIALADLRLGLRRVHGRFAESVHELDDGAIDAAAALALTQVDALREQVDRFNAEADRRRRLGALVLAALSLLFVSLAALRRNLGA